MVETSIIILNYNGKTYLKKCMDTVLAQDERDFEIIFVDNGSNDGSAQFVLSRYKRELRQERLRLIINKQNCGFAEGNNIGYRAARGKYVVLLNNDVIVPRGWLRKLIGPLRKYKDINIVGTAYYDKGYKNVWKEVLFQKRLGSTINLGGEIITIPRITCHEPRLNKAFYVSGNGLAMRKNDFKQPFDKEYFAYAEDTYLGWLAQLGGKMVVLNLDATMLHFGGSTKKAATKPFNSLTLFHGHKNQVMNYLIFYEWKNIFRVFPLFAMTQIGHVVDNPRKITIKAKVYWWILTHFKAIMRKRKAIQAQRKIPDTIIISRMSGKFFDENDAVRLYNRMYQRIIKMMNKLSLLYCRVVNLKVIELQPDRKRREMQ